MNKQANTLKAVQDYYGKILKTNQDLKTTACCSADILAPYLRRILSQIHPEVLDKFYGCGSPVPYLLEGKTILDLGCGSGRDCYLFSKLVGPSGSVIGIDMTDEQLGVARAHQDHHTKSFGYESSNVRFIKGFIEDLEGAGIKSQSIDVVTSNCVINLSPDKERVFAEIFRVLKPGGELFFSDVFASRRLPQVLRQDPTLVGECLGGALYTEDFRRLLSNLGCADFRILTQNKIDIADLDVAKQTGQIEFYSQTIRAFKLPLEDRCEDYGQAAAYLGGIPHSEDVFILDDHHSFEKGRIMPVCRNTAAMLGQTRYAAHFKIQGDTSAHFGLFDCHSDPVKKSANAAVQGCC